MVNKLVYKNLITLRNASMGKKIFVDVYYNNLFIFFLNFFYRKGYILGYVYNNYKKVRVFLKYYKDKGLLQGLVFSVNKPVFSYKALKYIRYHYKYEKHLYMFSTIKGFLTLDEIFLNNYTIGGVLYFCIILT